jgi:hypothetical protein
MCHISNIWWIEVQVSTWQTIHHGFASRKDLNGIADIRVRSVLFLTLQVYSDLKHYSSLFLLHYRIHSLLQSNKKLEALRVLAGKFNFPEDARKILEWANIRLRQGVESFLDNKLEQLGMLDKDGWMPI